MSDSGLPGTVVVVGAINVDMVVAASTLPCPGETVVGPGLETHGGGKGANAAVAAARAGASVRLVGAVGDDDVGRGVLGDLRDEGIEVEAVAELSGIPTGVALIVVDERGENQIAVGAGANAAVSAEQVSAGLDGVAEDDCVLVSTEIPGEAVVAAVTLAASAGAATVLNPAPVIPAVLEVLGAGPIMTPNANEMTDLIAMLPARGGLSEEHSPGPAGTAELAVGLRSRTGAPVIVTLGAEGALMADEDGLRELQPPEASVVDTTGAGDTFNGVLAAGLAGSEDLEPAVRRAVVAASLSVARAGARGGMPSVEEIEEALATAEAGRRKEGDGWARTGG
ncbi:MAG: PfkB family carbohydrate kinase [Solirubrobacterales bacterium]